MRSRMRRAGSPRQCAIHPCHRRSRIRWLYEREVIPLVWTLVGILLVIVLLPLVLRVLAPGLARLSIALALVSASAPLILVAARGEGFLAQSGVELLVALGSIGGLVACIAREPDEYA